MNKLFMLIATSLKRCKAYIISIFITYCLSCLIGIIMVHAGNNFALTQRDKIVDTAVHQDKASINYQAGNNLTAAMYDFAGNLFLAAIPQTLSGMGVAVPYLTVSYQGWICGIVSVNGLHISRFNKIKSALYYIIVALLQFIPYSLSIGSGIYLGVETYKHNLKAGWKIWKFRIRKENILDVKNIYLISIPLFFIASCFEFFSAWNI